MNWEQIQGDWLRLRRLARERWAGLSEDDLRRIDGRHEQLVGRLQELYGMSREEAEAQAENFRRTIQ